MTPKMKESNVKLLDFFGELQFSYTVCQISGIVLHRLRSKHKFVHDTVVKI